MALNFNVPVISDFLLVLTNWSLKISLTNSLWPNDTIWQYRSKSTLAQVMVWCREATSHDLNQCWLIISKIQWHSSEGILTRDTPALNFQIKNNFHSNLPGANELKCIWKLYPIWPNTLENIDCWRVNSMPPQPLTCYAHERSEAVLSQPRQTIARCPHPRQPPKACHRDGNIHFGHSLWNVKRSSLFHCSDCLSLGPEK